MATHGTPLTHDLHTDSAHDTRVRTGCPVYHICRPADLCNRGHHAWHAFAHRDAAIFSESHHSMAPICHCGGCLLLALRLANSDKKSHWRCGIDTRNYPVCRRL